MMEFKPIKDRMVATIYRGDGTQVAEIWQTEMLMPDMKGGDWRSKLTHLSKAACCAHVCGDPLNIQREFTLSTSIRPKAGEKFSEEENVALGLYLLQASETTKQPLWFKQMLMGKSNVLPLVGESTLATSYYTIPEAVKLGLMAMGAEKLGAQIGVPSIKAMSQAAEKLGAQMGVPSIETMSEAVW